MYVYKTIPSIIRVIFGKDSIELWHRRIGHPISQSLSLISIVPKSSSKHKTGFGCDAAIFLNILMISFLQAIIKLPIVFS